MAEPQQTPPPAETLTLKDRIWHRSLGQPYRLHVTDHAGPAVNSPVIVLLHGLASSSANWDPLVPLLQHRYRCISIDLLGFGDSPKPQWNQYSMDEHVRCLEYTIKKLKLRRPFTMLGHSLGSLLATRYARQHQRQVRRLILLSPPVYAPLDTISKRSAQRRTSWYLTAYKYIRTHKRVTYENFVRLSRILPLAKFLVLNSQTWLPFMRSLEQCVENQTLIQDIRDVHAPVEIFYGTFDEVVVPHNVRQVAKIGDVRLYPLRVDHMVGKRYAAAVAKVVAHTK